MLLGRRIQNYFRSWRRHGNRAEAKILWHSSRCSQHGSAQEWISIRRFGVRQPLPVSNRLLGKQRWRNGVLKSDASRGRRDLLLRSQGTEKSCSGLCYISLFVMSFFWVASTKIRIFRRNDCSTGLLCFHIVFIAFFVVMVCKGIFLKKLFHKFLCYTCANKCSNSLEFFSRCPIWYVHN